ncbi:DUF4136 domain-containing protein [Chromatiaceae bacterium AAb-1]|nr:DUF4136 domain-containing protein [Chromatiaceae bacterium AAb-1]
MSHRYVKRAALLFCAAAALVLASCSSGPKVRTDSAANVNFSNYKTFAFMPELATDKAGYTTLLTQHLKNSISRELTNRGYRYSETNPDLLVNFNSNVENRSETRTMPAATMHYGYYGYRRGIYTSFPIYTTEVDTIHYKYGTVNIDLVDAAKKQLVWEGISEGTLKKQDLAQPQTAIENVVGLIFQQFPVKAAN